MQTFPLGPGLPTGRLSVTPEQASGDLVKLLEQLPQDGSAPWVSQAAVWILEEDANLESLGKIRYLGEAAGHVIDEQVSVDAMICLERAGINLRGRAIWGDRLAICQAVLGKPGAGSTVLAWCNRTLSQAGADPAK